ncbi:hypothetical protein R5R35_008044 [Gryllus longicercus]|uniref:Transmembrane protein n=1 Tax=Gryllus longicercus TaxID=2509291 RepID=A0AAN9VR32_9ORTH
MACPSHLLPSKCCCCTLRTGSILVGVFSMIIGLIFMALAIVASRAYGSMICNWEIVNGSTRKICTSINETHKLASNLMAFLSIWNALEVMISVGLIWGVSKVLTSWLTAWLVVSICWIALHSATALAFIFATSATGAMVAVAVIGVFLLAMSVLSVLTVASLQNELNGTHHPPNCVVPAPQFATPSTVVNFSGYHPAWYAQSQSQSQSQLPPQLQTQGSYNPTMTAPPVVSESAPAE